MSDKRKLVFDAFDNKKTQRVPVGFWFHFAPDDLFNERPDVIRRNVEGHFQFYDTFKPDFVKLMSDGYFRYPNPTLAKVEKAEDLLKAKSGLVDAWIDAQTALVRELTDHFGEEVPTFYNIFAPATVLGFVLEETGSKLTLAELIKKEPDILAYVLNVIKQDLARLAEV